MTLNEAINHLEETLSSDHDFGCAECRREHEQLLDWLKELKVRRENDRATYMGVGV